MAKLGRPTKYRPEMCDKVIKHMSQGYSKEATAAYLGINQDTLYDWIKTNKIFSEAIKQGQAKSLLFWEAMGIDGAMGDIEKFNVSSWIFNMKNRHGWKDKSDKEIDAMKQSVNIIELHKKVIDSLPS